MRKKVLLLVFLAFFILLSACQSGSTVIGPKREVSSYSEKALTVNTPAELDVTGDIGNIELFTWDKKEVKFEITRRLRGLQEKAVLENQLKDFSIKTEENENKIVFVFKYTGSIKSPFDKSVDLKIFAPKKVSLMRYTLDTGSIKLYDDTDCDLYAELDMVNVEINKFNGTINLKGNMCNLRIGDGVIKSNSSIKLGMGNIDIKARFEETKAGQQNFILDTDMGNIDLRLPADTLLGFENIGTVAVNEFFSDGIPSNVRVRSGMGKISIKKWR